mmetsp:Transcript_13658/g.18758  ORF Transcript_13658/g.18758 Transcript_13658/m.18758 type:complete len:1124 (+) Transcript_13658:141-3512(+)
MKIQMFSVILVLCVVGVVFGDEKNHENPLEKAEQFLSSSVKSMHNAATRFLERYQTEVYQVLDSFATRRHSHLPHHQRHRHVFFSSGHIDTQVAPAYHEDDHFKLLRRGHSPDTQYEFYVSMKKVHWKKVHEIISDMGWEKSVGKKRFQNYLPHNTFLFAGTEDEAAQLAEHRHVYWVGARNPLHKLSGPLQDRSGKLLKDYREANLSPEERGHDPNVIRLQFHSGVSGEDQIKQVQTDLVDLFNHNGVEVEVSYEDIRAGEGEEWMIYLKSDSEETTKRSALIAATHPSIHYIDFKPVFMGHNDLANAFIENGELLAALTADTLSGSNDYVSNRDAGDLSFLTGTDNDNDPYRIGIADTGIDWDNCFFKDDDMEFDEEMDNHRTIYYYDTKYGDKKDNYLHGTHMSGTLAGNENRGSADYYLPEGTFNGMCPDARLVMVDVGDDDNPYNVPGDLRELYERSYDHGARIGVYGWGSAADQLAYNDLDYRTDQFVKENPDFIPFFATGNRNYFRFPRLIDSPAAAKSGLAVGSTLGFHEATTRWYGRTGDEWDNLFNFFHTQICEDFTNWWLDPAFCGSFGYDTPCQSFQETAICPAFEEASDCCDYPYFKALCCEEFFQGTFNQTGSETYINEYTLDGQTNGGPLYDNRYGLDIVVPSMAIVSARSDQDTDSDNCGNDKGLLILNGTSMSAAVAAGAAQKIMQYIETGYYPFGLPSQDPDPWKVSQLLVKNILLTAAVPLHLYNGNQRQYYLDAAQDLFPNNRAGFGTPYLSRILYVEELTNLTYPYLRQFFAVGQSNNDDNHLYLDDNGRFRGCFRADPFATAFTVTIVWGDGPGTRGAALALVNNLDIVVYDYLGTRVHLNSNNPTFDSVNPFEQIRFYKNPNALIDQFPDGSDDCDGDHPTGCQFQQYTIVVYARVMVADPEDLPFSLVVHAARVENEIETPVSLIEIGLNGDVFNNVPMYCDKNALVCPHNCSGYGECDGATGYCDCFDGYDGIDCSLSVCGAGCNNNGVCDGETGSCLCSPNYVGTYCEVRQEGNEPAVIYLPTNCSCSGGGMSTGAVVGIAIACFIVGILLGLGLGAYLGIKWLVARKKKKVAELKQRLAMKNQGNFEGDAGVVDAP